MYCGGVYAGGEEISSVLEEMISDVLGAAVEDSRVSDGVSDEDGTSEVESAALLEGDTLGEGELEGAGVSLLGSGVLEGGGNALLEGRVEELGGLPELLGAGKVTVVGSAVDVSIVGETVMVGCTTDRTVD